MHVIEKQTDEYKLWKFTFFPFHQMNFVFI